ncbi:MAG: class I SAM-dependent methyltransferase [Pseudomonadota bacterium]
MSGFSADWLQLREPADRRARWSGAAARLVAELPVPRAARIVDLGSGTGANLRYLAPQLGREHHWLLVDNDAALQAATVAACRGTSVRGDVELRLLDLAQGLNRLDFAAADLVTGAALLDLVSSGWFDALAARCHAARAHLLFALNYNGQIALAPEDPDDAWVGERVNEHQLGDKGFGPALGPTATQYAQRRLQALGYVVHIETSNWRLGEDDLLLQERLIAGWADAAAELSHGDRPRLHAWLQRRLAHVASGASRIVVGHHDLLALLPSPQVGRY